MSRTDGASERRFDNRPALPIWLAWMESSPKLQIGVMLDCSESPMMFGFGRAGSPSRPLYGLHAHSPWAARRSAPTNNLPVIYVSLNTHLLPISLRRVAFSSLQNLSVGQAISELEGDAV